MPYGRKKSKTFNLRASGSRLINFLAMFAGFILASIVLLMLIGKIFQQKPATSTSEKAAVSPRIESDSEIATSTSIDLASKLSTMIDSESAASLPVQVDQLRQRIKIANQLLILENTESQKELGVIAKIDSLAGLLDLAVKNQFDFLKEKEELNETCEKYQTDRNERIRTRIQLTRFRLHGLSIASGKTEADSDFLPLVEEIKPLLQMELSRDEQLHLRKSFETFSEVSKPFCHKLESAIFEKGSFQKKLNAIGRELRDKAKVLEYDLVKNAVGVLNELPEARERTFEVVPKIAGDPLGGERIITELVSILDWVEQIQELNVAKEAFQALIDSAPERATSDLKDTVLQLGKDGLRRCELVGKTFEFGGIEVDQENWTPESLSNQWTVILFIKAEASAFSDVVLQSGIRELLDLGFKVLVVRMSDTEPTRPTNPGEGLYVKEESFSRIFEQYPVRYYPQAILVNSNGKVVRTAIPMRSLTLLAQKAKEEESQREKNSNSGN